MKHAALEPYYAMLHMSVSTCPFCGGDGAPFGGYSVIYRLSHRAVTMRCKRCTLQWTMTMHQIADAVKVWETMVDDSEFGKAISQDLARAFDVKEIRGRSKNH